MWLLANWKIVVAAAGTFALCLMLHKLDVGRIEAKHATEITRLRNAMTEACNVAQETTRKVSHEYQIQLGSLNSKLSAAQRLHDHKCVAVTGITSSRHDAASAGKELSGRDAGIAAGALIDLAGRAEKVRIQLIACQSFVSLENGAGAGR